VTLFS